MRSRARHDGFTLLEVMVAVALVAIAMVVIAEMQSRAALKTNDAMMITKATLLARGKILDVQETLKEEGFGDFMKVFEGDFEEEGFPELKWMARVRKVEVPMPGAMGGEQGNQPTDGSGGLSLGMLAPMLQNFGTVLEGAVREIEVRVIWQEGRYEDYVSVTTHTVSRDLLNSGMLNAGVPTPPPSIPGRDNSAQQPQFPGLK